MAAGSSLLAVALLALMLALAAEWMRDAQAQAEAQRTAEGFTTLIEGLYAYRTNNVTSWPANFNELIAFLPNLNVDSGQPRLAGANGEGGRYTLNSVSGVRLITTVSTERHARAVTREFGTNGSYSGSGSAWTITVGVPDPGSISVLAQTLLIDGSNKMARPLWVNNRVIASDPCTDDGFGINAAGDLMACRNGVWVSH